MNWYTKLSQSYMRPEYWGYWLDPNGKLLPCNDKQGHTDVLREINIPHYAKAYEMGYVRLVTDDQILYVNNDGRRLTSAQIRALNQMSRNYSFVKFVTDGVRNGTDDYVDSVEFNDPASFKTHLRDLQQPEMPA